MAQAIVRSEKVLQRIAEQEATGLLSGAAVSGLSTDELDRVEAMESDGLVRVRNERVRFSHDLLGDCPSATNSDRR